MLHFTKDWINPRTLYTHRSVVNAADIIRWAKAQGFKTTLPEDKMHVTIAFSRVPMVWPAALLEPVVVPTPARRSVEQFDGGAVVLRFSSPELLHRWQELRDRGASWDWPEFHPHITITYDPGDVDIAQVTPFYGPILLGQERMDEVQEDWKDGVVEKADWEESKHPRDDIGRWAEAGGATAGGAHRLHDPKLDEMAESVRLGEKAAFQERLREERKQRVARAIADPWKGTPAEELEFRNRLVHQGTQTLEEATKQGWPPRPSKGSDQGFLKPFSEDQSHALLGYVRNSHDFVNKELRLEKGNLEAIYDHIKTNVLNLDETFARTKPLSESLKVYRGLDKNVTDLLSNLPNGSEFIDHGFVSTSIVHNVAKTFADMGGVVGGLSPWDAKPGAVVEVHVPAGNKAVFLPWPQREAILPRGTKFGVGRMLVEGVTRLVLRVLDKGILVVKAKADWDESKHPRDDIGRWAEAGGATAGGENPFNLAHAAQAALDNAGKWFNAKVSGELQRLEDFAEAVQQKYVAIATTPAEAALHDEMWWQQQSRLDEPSLVLHHKKYNRVVNSYVRHSHDFANGELRAAKGDTKKISAQAQINTKELDEIIDKTKPTLKSFKAYRGLSKEMTDKLSSLPDGTEFIDHGFVSTSVSHGQAKIFADLGGMLGTGKSSQKGLVAEVHVPVDRKVLFIPGIQQEAVLPRGTKFSVSKFVAEGVMRLILKVL